MYQLLYSSRAYATGRIIIPILKANRLRHRDVIAQGHAAEVAELGLDTDSAHPPAASLMCSWCHEMFLCAGFSDPADQHPSPLGRGGRGTATLDLTGKLNHWSTYPSLQILHLENQGSHTQGGNLYVISNKPHQALDLCRLSSSLWALPRK